MGQCFICHKGRASFTIFGRIPLNVHQKCARERVASKELRYKQYGNLQFLTYYKPDQSLEINEKI